jgi:hypothetical protein
MIAISQIQTRRLEVEGKETEFVFRERPVAQHKIERFQKRHALHGDEASKEVLLPNAGMEGSHIPSRQR